MKHILWIFTFRILGVFVLLSGCTKEEAKPVVPFTVISGGDAHSLALKKDGTIWAWGLNHFGELGDGTHEDKNYPIQIGSDYEMISAGYVHSLRLKKDGTLWSWGHNNFGQ